MNCLSRALLRNILRAMDQGNQFTDFNWVQALKDANIKNSMPFGDFTNLLPEIDDKGRWVDNRMIERLWHTHGLRKADRAKGLAVQWISEIGMRLS